MNYMVHFDYKKRGQSIHVVVIEIHQTTHCTQHFSTL